MRQSKSITDARDAVYAARGSWIIARSVLGFGYSASGCAERHEWLAQKLFAAEQHRWQVLRFRPTHTDLYPVWGRLVRRIEGAIIDNARHMALAVHEEAAARHEPLEVYR